MRYANRFFTISLVLGLAACRDTAAPPFGPPATLRPGEPRAQEGRYLVALKPDVQDPRAEAAALVAKHGGSVGYVYTKLLRGFSARLTSAALAALKANPRVLYVEDDDEVTADTVQSFGAVYDAMWGLDRIDQRTQETDIACGFLTNRCYGWNHNGAGVYVYVVDSGIDSSHVDFTGRAKNVFDVFGESGQDCNNHGTHVAGTIGSRTWGVAKGAYLRGVRVLDCQASGTEGGLIAGLEWIALNHTTPAVVNASVSGPFSTMVNDAVEALVQGGLFVAVSAGNDNISACAFSPSSAPSAVTVAAVKLAANALHKAEYSNWGSCVDIYAPGSFIASTRLGGGSFAASGTSQAAPHVAGTVAIYKQAFGDASPAVIADWLVTNSTIGVVNSNPAGTPNRFLYKAPGL